MVISPTLNRLAEVFDGINAPLYIVGGYVRNAALGFVDTDVDICSSLRPEQVKSLLKGTGFTSTVVHAKLGTLLIKSRFAPESYEYTPFRAEDYPEGGCHMPDKVEFITDVTEDAKRRDFTSNCIYYEIKYGVIVDPYGGLADIKSRLLKCIEKPEFVFKSDGLRILRLLRMGAELGFDLEENSFRVAKKLVSQLKDITRERFHKEVLGMLYADYRYTGLSKKFAHFTAMQNVTALGAWSYVLPELLKYDGIKRAKNNPNEIKLAKDAFVTLKQAPPELRLSALVYDLSVALGNLRVNYQFIDDVLGLKGLMIKKDEIKAATDLLRASRQAKTGFASPRDETIFIAKNYKLMPKLLEWQRIRGIPSNLAVRYNIMVVESAPMTLKDLAINGNDIKEHFPLMKPRLYSFFLNMCLEVAAARPELNTKKNLIKFIKDNNL